MEIQPVGKVIWRMQQHYNDYEEFRLADAYKMLYQGTLGPEHAIADPEAVREWLNKEWETIGASSREGLYVDISIQRPVYRINLRAAKALGITKSQIHQEFITLAKEFPKRPDLLRQYWKEISQQIRDGKKLVCNPEELDHFNREILKNDFPAVHHSPEYRDANKPAYRLVDEIID